MKLTGKILSLASVLAITGSLAFAQDNDSGEEQIVIEDLSRSELEAQIERIENEFYRVFNTSIDDENLMIDCGEYVPTNSHIKLRACEPKFVVDARNRNVQAWQNQTGPLLSPEEIRASLTAEFEELTAAMNAVLQDSQYFRELNAILGMLRERMEELDQQ